MSEAKIIEYGDGGLWYSKEGDTIIIGITQQAIDSTGSIQEIEWPELGDEFAADDLMGEIQGKNTDVAITAPEAIVVEELNKEVVEQPSLVEDDPTGDAWLLRAKLV